MTTLIRTQRSKIVHWFFGDNWTWCGRQLTGKTETYTGNLDDVTCKDCLKKI